VVVGVLVVRGMGMTVIVVHVGGVIAACVSEMIVRRSVVVKIYRAVEKILHAVLPAIAV
ncbi:MAG: hypothetical protein HQ580_13235, partial [Planctomycetes bacterium]|nr:hypothetical protein [Planctomycetota bacterium]